MVDDPRVPLPEAERVQLTDGTWVRRVSVAHIAEMILLRAASLQDIFMAMERELETFLPVHRDPEELMAKFNE